MFFLYNVDVPQCYLLQKDEINVWKFKCAWCVCVQL